jgi:hypothetical protein
MGCIIFLIRSGTESNQEDARGARRLSLGGGVNYRIALSRKRTRLAVTETSRGNDRVGLGLHHFADRHL